MIIVILLQMEQIEVCGKMAIIGKRICPNCGSDNVEMFAGGITGTWLCSNCGETGNFPEREIVGKSNKGKEDKVLDDIKSFMKESKGRKK